MVAPAGARGGAPPARRRWIAGLLVAVTVLVLAPAAGAAAGGAGLDSGYGSGGIARLGWPLPGPSRDVGAEVIAAGRDGSAYAVISGYGCAKPLECQASEYLVRYLPNGRQDRSFGGAGVVPVHAHSARLRLRVDGAGRAVLAEERQGATRVRRFLPSGRPDPGFGGDGEVGVPCSCSEGLFVSGGEITLVGIDESRRVAKGSSLTLARLDADGNRESSFGQAGIARLLVPESNFGGSLGLAVSPSGAVYSVVQGPESRSSVIRVDARGRLDRSFDARARRASRRLGKALALVVLPRPSGAVDVLGSADFLEHGFVMRLHQNGGIARGFGDRGERRLPSPVDGAVVAPGGGTLALFEGNLRPRLVVFRISPDGRVDRGFGRALGNGLRSLAGRGGLSLEATAGGRAMVLDLGLTECRGECPPQPRIARILVGRGGR